jgi:hypothetical protein
MTSLATADRSKSANGWYQTISNSLSITADRAGGILEPLAERAQAAVQAVAQSATEGILRVDDELHLTLAALEEDPKLAKLRAALDKMRRENHLLRRTEEPIESMRCDAIP